MSKFSYIAGFIAFVICVMAIRHILGPLICNDGWYSPSIGMQGACSYHGGVDHTKEVITVVLSILTAILIGIFVNKMGLWLDNHSHQSTHENGKGTICQTTLNNNFSGPEKNLTDDINVAISLQKDISIKYTGEKSLVTERRVTPQQVIMREGKLYLIGYCHLRQDRRTFRLERIQELRII